MVEVHQNVSKTTNAKKVILERNEVSVNRGLIHTKGIWQTTWL